MIDAVVYYSCSGNSKLVAQEVATKTGYCLSDIKDIACKQFNTLILVFPVHCQGAPQSVKKFLKQTTAENYALIATYGREAPGNALYEAAKFTRNRVTAAAYLPASHAYNEEPPSAETLPDKFYEAIGKRYVKIPRRLKAPFAGFFPSARSRTLLKIVRSADCINCNVCGSICPSGAIKCGKTNAKCIRCLKCVKNCPNGALSIKKGFILRRYLKKTRFDKIILYV